MRVKKRSINMKRLTCSILIAFSVLSGIAQHAFAQKDSPQLHREMVEIEGVLLDIDTWGSGKETIILLPGLGSDTSRFALLAPRLASAGYRVVALNPRQVRNSTGSLAGLTLDLMATDVFNLAKALNAGSVHLVGWAAGNRVSRTMAALYPEAVTTVTLLAAGGKVPPSAEAQQMLATLFTSTDLGPEEAFALVKATLYSPGSDAYSLEQKFRRKGYREARLAQLQAIRSAVLNAWWPGGTAPLLVVQGLDDKVAVPENGRMLREEFPDRVRLVELEDAGHMLPIEKPDAVAAHIVRFLRDSSTTH
jgi:pimeloyl-ACP methyl ester carboxylesterase